MVLLKHKYNPGKGNYMVLSRNLGVLLREESGAIYEYIAPDSSLIIPE